MESRELHFPAPAAIAESTPTPMAHEAVYDTVTEILRGLPRGNLLDVPAGEGALAKRLLELEFEVQCCDLYPEIFRLPHIDIRQGDLATTLPYESAWFAYVTCIEGLETHRESATGRARIQARVAPRRTFAYQRTEYLKYQRAYEMVAVWLHFAFQTVKSRSG